MEAENSKNSQESGIDQIIYAWNYLSWGGAQIYFLGLIKEASKHFKTKVLMPSGSDEQLISFFVEQGVDCVFFTPSFDPPQGRGLIARVRMHFNKIMSERAMLKALDAEFALDRSIVHIELAPWQSLFSLVWLAMRAPVFITMHNSLPSVNIVRRMVWRLKLRVVSRFRNFNVFASNRDARDFFKGFYSKALFDQILVTYTNVNPDEINEAYVAELSPDARKDHSLPENGCLVFCVGQFIDRKGRWVFLDAAKLLSRKYSDLHFVWISNSIVSSADRAKIESYGIGTRFSLIDSKDVGEEHIDLFMFLRLADVFVLPSLQEGLPISLLEAMALGIPSVSTSVNAIPEAIDDRRTGMLVEAGNPESLALAISELIENEALRKRVGIQGREKVFSDFNEQSVAKIALGAYLRVSRGAGL